MQKFVIRTKRLVPFVNMTYADRQEYPEYATSEFLLAYLDAEDHKDAFDAFYYVYPINAFHHFHSECAVYNDDHPLGLPKDEREWKHPYTKREGDGVVC